MKKIILFVLIAFLANDVYAQNEFITVWNMGNSGLNPNQLKFNVGTTGSVNYTWETIPAGITGSGTFTGTTATINGLPSNGSIRLKIDTANFNQIQIASTNYYYSDASRLINIEQWGTTVWTSMDSAFYACSNLTNITSSDIPDLSNVSSLKLMFGLCSGLYNISNINNWNTSQVNDMSFMFTRTAFNQPINNWDVSLVTDMSYMFAGTSDSPTSVFNAYLNNFNQPIGNWDVSNVTNMEGMFYGTKYNQPISNWDVSNVTNMSYMFAGAYNETGVSYSNIFNQPIGNWDVSHVTDMSYMFSCNSNFNQPIGNWDVSHVTDMSYMFSGYGYTFVFNPGSQYISVFNQPIGNWDVSHVTKMERMFGNNIIFNQPIGKWNVSNVTNMLCMFSSAILFNQPIGSWNISNVTNMTGMFRDAILFNQDIGNWQFSSIELSGVSLSTCGMDCSNYSSTLKGWANNVNMPNGIYIGSQTLHYSTNVQAERDYLINKKGWMIIGDTMSNNSCSSHTNISITISHNPTKSIFKIECPMNGANVILYNSFGQKLLTSKIENQTALIDISQFPVGIYIAEILDNKSSYRVKIVKE